VLVIDAPEHGLALQQLPILADVLVRTILENDGLQVIIATHNFLLPALTIAKIEEERPAGGYRGDLRVSSRGE